MSFFSLSRTDSPNFFVGGNTLHSCHMSHIKFDYFFLGRLVGALKLIVLLNRFYEA